MNRRAYGQAMVALLGLGTADLAALNLLAIPELFEPATTEVSSATDAPVRAAPVAKVAAPSPQPKAAAPVQPVVAEPESTAPRPQATVPEPPAARSAARAESQTLLFSRGAWWISPSKRRALEDAIARLGPNAIVEVDGHADYTGPNDVNQRISERRAAAVVDLLLRSGIAPGRIRKRAHGENQPTGTGNDRRVEIIIRGEP